MYLGDNLIADGITALVDDYRRLGCNSQILLAKVPQPVAVRRRRARERARRAADREAEAAEVGPRPRRRLHVRRLDLRGRSRPSARAPARSSRSPTRSSGWWTTARASTRTSSPAGGRTRARSRTCSRPTASSSTRSRRGASRTWTPARRVEGKVVVEKGASLERATVRGPGDHRRRAPRSGTPSSGPTRPIGPGLRHRPLRDRELDRARGLAPRADPGPHRGLPDRQERPHPPGPRAAAGPPVPRRRQLRDRHRMKLLVTGGCGFIGSNFIRHVLESRGGRRLGRQPGQADLRRQPRQPRRRGPPAELPLRAGRHRRPGRRRRWRWRGATRVVNFAAETHVDRSLLGDASFIETDVRGVFVLLEEARRRGVRKFIQISTDEVYGTIAERLLHRGVAAQPAQPLRRLEGRRRPPRLLLLGLVRHAGRHHARLQQLRAVPVPGEAHPALRHQRDRRPAAAALRRRPERARLALRARPRRGDRLPARRRASRARPTTSPAATRPRTSRSRGGSCAQLGKPESLIRFVDDRPGHDRRYSLDAAKLARARLLAGRRRSRRASSRRCAGIATTRSGGAPSRSATPPTASSTARSTSSGWRPPRPPRRSRASRAGSDAWPDAGGAPFETHAAVLAAPRADAPAPPAHPRHRRDRDARLGPRSRPSPRPATTCSRAPGPTSTSPTREDVARAVRELAPRRRRQLRRVHEGGRLRVRRPRLRGQREGGGPPGRRLRPLRGAARPDLDRLRVRRREGGALRRGRPASIPLSAYGRSKRPGRRPRSRLPGSLVVRASWLFGRSGWNFVEAILKQVEGGKKRLAVVADQVGRPTATTDLSEAIAALLEAGASGVYHFANRGEVSWNEFAREIVWRAGSRRRGGRGRRPPTRWRGRRAGRRTRSSTPASTSG